MFASDSHKLNRSVCESFSEHSSEKSDKVDELVSTLVNWYHSVLASNFAIRARIIFLTLMMLATPLVTAVKMFNDYKELNTLKNEMLMEKEKLNANPNNLQSADTLISVRGQKFEQYSIGQSIT
ncbi:hypothetical protein [Hymenobacter sp.]|uniref:hypothetical protein n=1 Tax=Hymenobacter sp. TaxID=1898978 RepID=UPI00286CE255|nr:hypothetical protein [Hymenobacter sp.]